MAKSVHMVTQREQLHSLGRAVPALACMMAAWSDRVDPSLRTGQFLSGAVEN